MTMRLDKKARKKYKKFNLGLPHNKLYSMVF